MTAALQPTVSVVHQQSTGSPEVNRVPDGHFVQVLGQLSSLWKGGVGVLVVHLVTSQQEGVKRLCDCCRYSYACKAPTPAIKYCGCSFCFNQYEMRE